MRQQGRRHGQENAVKGTCPQHSVCGVIVRLYKYLLPEYYSDFYASLLAWASRLQLVLDDGHRPEAHERDCNLRVLYGNLVLPWELLQALNNGLDSLTHYVEAGELAMYLRDREGLRMHWVRQLVEVRRKKERRASA